MKGSYWILLTAALVLVRFQARAQVLGASSSRAGADGVALRTDATTTPAANPLIADTNAIVQKKITISSPLVPAFKAKRLRDVPRHLVHLINPFAPSEPKPEYPRAENLSPRAWSTTVGWHPGESTFPDPVTHEATMSLVSFSRTK